MKKFLAVYTGSPSAQAMSEWQQLDQETRQDREKTGMEAWGNWVKSNVQNIIDVGTPLGKTKRISAEGIRDFKNEIVAYVILLAESHEAAAKMFENHPHFTMFPGEAIEVMECLPMPGG